MYKVELSSLVKTEFHPVFGAVGAIRLVLFSTHRQRKLKARLADVSEMKRCTIGDFVSQSDAQ